VVVYLAIVQGLGWVLTRGLDADYAAPTTVEELWRGITVPVLGWWRPVLVDDRPVRRWVPDTCELEIQIEGDFGPHRRRPGSGRCRRRWRHRRAGAAGRARRWEG
jgi:hypothetical protein